MNAQQQYLDHLVGAVKLSISLFINVLYINELHHRVKSHHHHLLARHECKCFRLEIVDSRCIRYKRNTEV